MVLTAQNYLLLERPKPIYIGPCYLIIRASFQFNKQ